jgi:molybdate transport system regulatory protein
MARAKQSRTRRTKRLSPRVKVWIEIDGQYGFGFGVSEILRAVDRTGSIKQAADDLGKSYRYVWGRIKDAEDAIGESLVATQVGGQGTQRSFLTDRARQLVDNFLAMRSSVNAVLAEEFARRFPC